jgi:hypothetical protein
MEYARRHQSLTRRSFEEITQYRQRTYVWRNIEGRPRHLLTKSSITYSECVFVALVIQHEKRMRRIMLWFDSTVLKIECVREVAVHLQKGVGSDVHERLYRPEQ